MTTPTSFSLFADISACNTLTFSNGVDSLSHEITQTSINLLGASTKGYILPEGVVAYLTGSYVDGTNVFTVGAGDRILFWNGSAGEFASVGKNGGNWGVA